MSTVGAFVRAERERKRWSGAELATRASIAPEHLDQVENDEPSGDPFLPSVLSAMNLDLSDLVEALQAAKPPAPSTFLIDRRTLLGAFAGFAMTRLYAVVSGYFSIIGAQREHVDIARALFLPENWDIVAACHHPTLPQPQTTYSNEQAAIRGIVGPFGCPDQEPDSPWTPDPTKSQICLGSSISNHSSRTILGNPLVPRFELNTPFYNVAFDYSIACRADRTTWRIQDNQRHSTKEYYVVDRNGNAVATPKPSNSGELEEDFLLVTRLPGPYGGPDWVVFAGLHGPAIRAIPQLFFDRRLPLEDILKVSDARYFQAIFKMKVRREGVTTVPSTIERASVPPVPVRLRAHGSLLRAHSE